MTDKMAAEQALDAVRNVLQRAYNSAAAVCCGRAGTECCGSPEPEWSEYDQRIIDDLQPVEKYLSQALSAPRVSEGWSIKRSERGEAEAILIFDIGGYAAGENGRSGIAESILYHLCNDMLAAAPAPDEITMETDISEMVGDYPGTVGWTGNPAPADDDTCPECGQTGAHREGCPDTYWIGHTPKAPAPHGTAE
jgi:hypothetical protein